MTNTESAMTNSTDSENYVSCGRCDFEASSEHQDTLVELFRSHKCEPLIEIEGIVVLAILLVSAITVLVMVLTIPVPG